MSQNNAAPGKRERNKKMNRQTILEAARRCFMTQGLDAVTVRDIIRVTGLATGTFYNYFNDKEEVFSALIEEIGAGLTGELHEIRRQADDLESFLHDTYLHFFRFFAAEPGMFQLISRNDPYLREKYEGTVLGTSMEYLKADIREAIQRGLMPEIDEEYLAAAFYGVAYEMSRVLVSRKDGDPQHAARIATKVFLKGLSG